MTMSDQSKIYTLGPTDEKAGFRAKAYAGLSALLGLITLAVTFGLVTAQQGASIAQIVQGAIGLLGAGGLAVAASKTRTQVKDGTFDPVPAAPEATAFDALAQIKAQADAAVLDAQGKVAQGVAAIQGAVAMIPGGSGPVADLLKAVAALDRKADS